MEENKPLGARLGEGMFCIIYLVYTFAMIFIMKRNYNIFSEMDDMVNVFRFGFGFMMALLLVGGDLFHLVPRIIVSFKGSMWKKDFFFGLGTLLSSITMTLFYNVLIAMGDSMEYNDSQYNLYIEKAILILTIIRIIILILPQNKWYSKEPVRKWAVIRNIPFTLIGILTVIGFINVMINASIYPKTFYLIIMITVILSFAFYLPVAIWGKENPKIGVLMLPKTMCYMIMIGVITFWKII